MPLFLTTYNILVKRDEDELFDPNWMDSDKIVLPPKRDWDYSRELQIEDVSIWELIYRSPSYFELYAAWDPYAEFYLVIIGVNNIQTFYGPGALAQVKRIVKEHNIPVSFQPFWVEPEDMWMYEGEKYKLDTKDL